MSKTGEQLRTAAAGKIALDIAAEIARDQRQRHTVRVQSGNQRIRTRHERRAFIGKNLVAQREPARDEIIERHRLPQRLVQHLQIHLRRFTNQFLKQFRPDR